MYVYAAWMVRKTNAVRWHWSVGRNTIIWWPSHVEYLAIIQTSPLKWLKRVFV